MIFVFIETETCGFSVISRINFEIHEQRWIFGLFVTYSEILMPVFMIKLFEVIMKLLSSLNIVLDLRSINCLHLNILNHCLFNWTLWLSFPSFWTAMANTLQFIFNLNFFQFERNCLMIKFHYSINHFEFLNLISFILDALNYSSSFFVL